MGIWRRRWKKIKQTCLGNLDGALTCLFFVAFVTWLFAKTFDLESLVAITGYVALAALAFAAGTFFQRVITVENTAKEIKEKVNDDERRIQKLEQRLILH